MVDGKGGNLKTIHHYNAERILITTLPFRLFLKTNPFLGLLSSIEEKDTALVPVAFPSFYYLYVPIRRKRFFSPPPTLIYEKFIFLNLPGIRFFLLYTIRRFYPLLVPFHILCSYFQQPAADSTRSQDSLSGEPLLTETVPVFFTS